MQLIPAKTVCVFLAPVLSTSKIHEPGNSSQLQGFADRKYTNPLRSAGGGGSHHGYLSSVSRFLVFL